MLLLLLLPKVVVGNSATATNAEKLGGKSSTEYTTKEDFAILTGTLNMITEQGSEYSRGSVDISYPSGFNKDNCVVISIGLNRNTNTASKYAFGTESTEGYSAVKVRGTMGRSVALRSDKMTLYGYFAFGGDLTASSASTETYNYVIVLMKIS